MKKFVLLILVVVCLALSMSCKHSVDLKMYVSESRTNIYEYKSDDFNLLVYAEKIETPFISDGYVGELKNVLIVKLDSQIGWADGSSILITVGSKEYSGKFEYNPVGGKFTVQITVDELPTTPTLNAKILREGESKEVVLKTELQADTISVNEALNSVKAYDKETINNLFGNTVLTEIHVRLLADSDRNYYYVGLVEKSGQTHAYLVDGKSGKTLAKKSVKHQLKLTSA